MNLNFEIEQILNKYPKIQGFTNNQERLFFRNLLIKNNNIKNILEIGFNAGHSSLNFLESRNDIYVDSVDLGSNPYVNECGNLLKNYFKNRFNLLIGSSLNILPKLNKKYDLIFIDGGHLIDIVRKDMENSLKLSHENTIIILDDCIPWEKWSRGVYQTVINNLKNNKIKNLKYYYSNKDGVFELNNLDTKGNWEDSKNINNNTYLFSSIWAVCNPNYQL